MPRLRAKIHCGSEPIAVLIYHYSRQSLSYETLPGRTVG